MRQRYRYEPTYKGLKHTMRPEVRVVNVGYEPTYKGLKQLPFAATGTRMPRLRAYL